MVYRPLGTQWCMTQQNGFFFLLFLLRCPSLNWGTCANHRLPLVLERKRTNIYWINALVLRGSAVFTAVSKVIPSLMEHGQGNRRVELNKWSPHRNLNAGVGSKRLPFEKPGRTVMFSWKEGRKLSRSKNCSRKPPPVRATLRSGWKDFPVSWGCFIQVSGFPKG